MFHRRVVWTRLTYYYYVPIRKSGCRFASSRTLIEVEQDKKLQKRLKKPPDLKTPWSLPDKLVYTAFQPTGCLHIGNYFGAISTLLDFQNEVKTPIFVSIADLHALTDWKPREVLQGHILDLIAGLLACRLDPDICTLFVQSDVPEHTQLAWILGCFATVPQLSRLGQYKDKSAAYASTGAVPIGLLTYPVLQAADILLYKATHVPVGEDQSQHLALTHQIARSFNARTGLAYFHDATQVESKHPRVKSLRNPDVKMSKSDPSNKGRIEIGDDPDLVRQKIQKALTDFHTEVDYDPVERPAVANLIHIHSMVSGRTVEDIVNEYCESVRIPQYKMAVADALNEFLTPIYEDFIRFRNDQPLLRDILAEGAEKARKMAHRNMGQIRQIVGLKLTISDSPGEEDRSRTKGLEDGREEISLPSS